MNTWLLRVAAPAIVAVLIATGCGGGESSSSATGVTSGSTAGAGSAEKNPASAPDRGEFVKQANAICQSKRQNGFNRIAAYAAEHRSEGLSEEELTKEATKAVLVQIVEAELAALRELEPPAGEEGKVDAVLKAVQRAIDKAKSKETKSRTANEIEAYLGGADKQLKAIGLGSCTKAQV